MRAELLSLSLFGCAGSEGGYLAPPGSAKLERHMAEATDAHNAYAICWLHIPIEQWAEYCDTTAK